MKQQITGLISILLIPIISFSGHGPNDERISFQVTDPAPEVKSVRLSNNVKLEYVEQGERGGVTVIFLHGYSDSWHSYETTLPHLPKNVHAYAISQRGHGNSDKPSNGYNPKDLANDVALFMRHQKIRSAVIVGHSMGGLVAQRFALDHPDLCKGVVIVSSSASFLDNPGVPEFLGMIDELKDPVDRNFIEEFQKGTISRPIDSSYFSRLVDESSKLPARVWKSIAKELLQVNYTSELKSIHQPVLIVWGDKDSFCLRDDQDTLHKNIRKASLVVYVGTGHALHWEEPQRFAIDLVKFIGSL